MFYKQYGNTGIEVSSIGFGCMRYDMKDVRKGDFEKCAEVVRYAHSKGINYFDTAPYYCDDKSEEITGLALSGFKRDSFYVTSKTNFGTLYENPCRDTFFKRLETSLERLKVDYIDFYHLWCILSEEKYQQLEEKLYGFFEEARSQGMIKNIVFSSHMDGDGINHVINTDKYRGMLIGYNPINYRFRQEGIAEAYNKGLGIVVMNPLGGGLIPQNPEHFSYLAKGTNLTVPQASLRFVASHKEVSVALCGFTTKEHVDDAIVAVQGIENEQMSAAEIIKKYSSDEVSINDLCTGCGYCDECPVGIPIPKFMDSYNVGILGGDIEERLLNHWGKLTYEDAAKCVACGKCEDLCTQHLPIIQRLKDIENRVDVSKK